MGKTSARTELGVPILIFTGVMILNILVTPTVVPLIDRLGELRWIFVYWGLAKILEILWSEQTETRILKVWLISLCIASAYGVFQFFTGQDPVRAGFTEHLIPTNDVFRATGFFSLCLTYAYSMGISGFSLTLPVLKLHRYTPLTTLSLGGIAVLVSMTRGAWIAFAASGALMTLLVHHRLNRPKLVAIASIVFIPILGLVSMDGASERLSRLIHFYSDAAVIERFHLWKAYFHMFLDNPIFGVGYRQGADFTLAYYGMLEMPQNFVSHAHNDYLQVLAETGLTGFIAFLFLLGSALWKTYELRKHQFNWAISLLVGQVFIFLGSLSQANFTDSEVNHFLLFNWAIVSAFINRIKR